MELHHDGTLKIAFLGGAVNSAVGFAHYSAIRLVNEFEIVAGCFSRNEGTNRETGKQYGIAADRVYSTLEELLVREKGKLATIVILTPTDQHTKQVMLCLQHGYAVVCEKALACNTSDAIRIRNELSMRNGFLSVIYNYLGYPMLRELRNIIDLGKIGKVFHVQVEMPQEGFKRINADGKPVLPQEWRLHDGSIPTISLDLGVHLHMLVRYLTGKFPLQTVATSESFGNFVGVTDNVSGTIQYTDELVCNMWYSKVAIGNRNGLAIRVFGHEGSAEWIQETPELLQLADRRGNRWTVDRGSPLAQVCNQLRYTRFKAGHPAGFIEALANYYTDIAYALEEYQATKKPLLNSNCFGVAEALEGLALFEAMSISAFSRSWQMVNEHNG